jgi:hypothetical protein
LELIGAACGLWGCARSAQTANSDGEGQPVGLIYANPKQGWITQVDTPSFAHLLRPVAAHLAPLPMLSPDFVDNPVKETVGRSLGPRRIFTILQNAQRIGIKEQT